MEATEIIAAAVRFSASSREADLRSAVSRAYYGVYDLALDFISQTGVSLPTAADSHEKLVWCLEAVENEFASKVAVRLGSLRKERNVADYDLRDARFRSAANVRTQLERVRELMALAGCNAEPARSEIHAKMRAYAKNTLRLIVADDANGPA